ncbi:MAG: LamG-like jellyroll fold domain-containing protein [Romboutsia timonensis]
MALKLWYPFTKDLSNNGYPFENIKTYNNIELCEDGKLGKCAYFNGGNIKVPTFFNENPQEMSLCAWLKATNNETNYGFHLCAWGNNMRICFLKDKSAVRAIINKGDGTTGYSSILKNTEVEIGKWYHIAVTYKNGRLKIYINGDIDIQHITATTELEIKDITPFSIGTYSSETASCYVNDYRLYDHCLSDTEVKEISKGLVLHYTMDNIYEENKVYDSSGFGNDGVLVGDILTLSNSQKYKNNILIKSQNINDYTSISGASYIRSKCEIGDVSQITINWWANIYSYGHQASGIFTSSQDGETPTNYLQAGFNQYDAVFKFLTTDDISNSLSATNLIMQNEWHMYSLVFNGETIKSYRDGILFESKDLVGKLKPFTQIFIGLSNAGGAYRKIIGEWSDFRVYSTALNEKDILQLYQERERIDNEGNLYCSELNEVERRVDYLESSGGQYIDTEYVPNQDTRLVIKFLSTSFNSQSLFGARKNYGTNNYSFWTSVDGTLTRDSYGSNNHINWDMIDFSQGAVIDKNKQNITIMMINSETNYFEERSYTQIFDCGVNLYLGTTNNNGSTMSFFVGKIYYCQIWDNDILVRDFLPVISTEEGHIGEACLFDTVENKYYYNQGTKKFTTNLDESTTNIDFTSKGIVNTDYIIEGKEQAKIKNDGNIIEVNEIYEN